MQNVRSGQHFFWRGAVGKAFHRLAALLLMAAIGVSGCVNDESNPLAGRGDIKEEKFTYRVIQIDAKKNVWSVIFENAPSFVHPLPMAPLARESELNRGTWVVIAANVGSVPDVNGIGMAVKCLRKYGGKIQLGVRPFVEYEEINKWFPDYGNNFGSPLWLVLRDGKVCGWEAMPFTEEQFKRFLSKSLS
jgi:hypothetical protein